MDGPLMRLMRRLRGHLSGGAATLRGQRRPLPTPYSTLHSQILAVVTAQGAIDDETLERLSAFATYAPSTVRKRRSELAKRGALVAVGTRPNSRGRQMTLWDLASRAYR